jgi:hypothetical protein
MAGVRVLVVSLLAAGCVLALSACGGGSGGTTTTKAVDAGVYTGSVCATIATWQQHLGSASTMLGRRTNTAKSLRYVRTQFVAFYTGAIGETDKMLAAVGGAGVPDVNQGDRVAKRLLQSLRRFRQILVAARVNARALPVGDEQKFTIKAQSLGVPFEFERVKLETLWDDLGKRYAAPELARAASADPSCRSLR